jgi:pimeloyl-ACP methyl ester carboxylesterase
VGDRRLTYVGLSHGSMIGQTYANLFPGRVRTMLLDGIVELSRTPVPVGVRSPVMARRSRTEWRNCSPGRAGRRSRRHARNRPASSPRSRARASTERECATSSSW